MRYGKFWHFETYWGWHLLWSPFFYMVGAEQFVLRIGPWQINWKFR